MSPSIWTRCAARCKPRTITLIAFRVVESQHVVSTRKLVDSGEEQALLEELVDRVKPPLPSDPELRRLHYLLSTPFRHPPLRYGSRFGTRAPRQEADLEGCTRKAVPLGRRAPGHRARSRGAAVE